MKTRTRAAVTLAVMVGAPIITATAASATEHVDPCPGDHVTVWAEVGIHHAGQATDHFVCGPLKGEKGATGDTGPQGNLGPAGPQGPAGAPGTPGVGLPGLPGPQGTPGPQGPAGPAGSQGVPGSNGADGDDGEVGPKGDSGSNGTNGLPGSPGTPGSKGQDGVSTFINSFNSGGGDCANGGETFIFGTDDENADDDSAVTICNGEDGKPGKTGPIGPQGPAGTTTIVQADGSTTTVDGLPKTGTDSDTAWTLGLIGFGILALGGGTLWFLRKQA